MSINSNKKQSSWFTPSNDQLIFLLIRVIKTRSHFVLNQFLPRPALAQRLVDHCQPLQPMTMVLANQLIGVCNM
jgi:hypothetical protein